MHYRERVGALVAKMSYPGIQRRSLGLPTQRTSAAARNDGPSNDFIAAVTRPLLGLILALAPLGCAPRHLPTSGNLDPDAALGGPTNTPWRNQEAQKLADFKASNRATLWAIGQELNGRISAAWPPPEAPIKLGGVGYFSEDTPGQRYPIFYRSSQSNTREIVLDLNREFPTTTADIGFLKISPDNTRIAFSLDLKGTGSYELYTRELPDGAITGPLAPAVHEAEWGAGGVLFYTTLAGLRATTVSRLRPQGAPETVPLTVSLAGHLAIHASGDGEMVAREITPRGGKVWRLSPSQRATRPTPITVAGKEWRSAAVIDGCFFGDDGLLLVERNGLRELVWSAKRAPMKPQVLPLAGENPRVIGIRCFARHVVAYGRADNRGALWYLATGESSPSFARVATPFGLTALTLGAHPSPAAGVVRVQLSSLINPPILYELDLESGAFTAQAQMNVVNHHADRYTTAQLATRAPDGVAVPISVAYRQDGAPVGSRPVLLTTYGAYGANASTDFDEFYLPLLERGFVIAVAHIRGGGEGGPGWHEASRGVLKSVGTNDLVAAAEALRRLGWGGARRIALTGRSAGAIAVAGAAALRPDLFGAIVLDAPFLDPVKALSDPTRALVVRERAEWGDPSDPVTREAIRKYGPFDLKVDSGYPATLVTVHENDTAVSPLDGARWIDRLNGIGARGSLISVDAGTHSGAPTRSEATAETALRATFILAAFGLAG